MKPIEVGRGGRITVKVSVGAPLEGVSATVYAIDPVTGLPITDRQGGAVLAEASGSNAAGELLLQLAEDASWDGPIQMVVSGTEVLYVDPTTPPGSAPTQVALPNDFRLSSYVSNYQTGTEVTVPVTMWTSLADEAVLAYVRGANPASATTVPLERAMPLIDDLFAKHLSRPQSWDLRSSVPVAVSANVGIVRESVFAALADVALNQLARDVSQSAGRPPGTAITAYHFLELLRSDVSDGLFDGRHADVQLAARGGSYELASRTTRFDLARALGNFIDAPSNATGLTRGGLEGFSVFDNIALDRSILYPTDEDPRDFDDLPPAVELIEPLPEYVSVADLTVRVRAIDAGAGVAHVRASVEGGLAQTVAAVRNGDHWELPIELGPGNNVLRIWAEDSAVPANSGKELGAPYLVRGGILLDTAAPAVSPRSAPSHRNENGVALKLAAGGRPVVPGALDLSGQAKVDLVGGGSIHKTYVTSSWGEAPPTGLVLEGENPRNLPFRQFAVAYSAEELGSPLAAITWRIAGSDGTSVRESSGDAIPSALEVDGSRIFDVVFSQETIPLLKTTTARTVNFVLTFVVEDAAGNTTESGPFEHAYELLDTPLHFSVDAEYSGRKAPGSIYGYFTNRDRYRELFSPSNPDIAKAGTARIGRVEILNPWAVPVAVRQSNSPLFSMAETWANWTTAESGATVSIDDGFTFNRVENWAAEGAVGQLSCLNAYDSICGFGWRTTKHIRHDKWSSAGLVCAQGKTPPAKSWKTPAGTSVNHLSARYVRIEANPSASQAEVLAERMSSDAAVVPAADGASAGRVVVFPGISATALQRQWGAAWDGVTSFSQVAGIVYVEKGPGAMCENEFGTRERAIRYEAETWHQSLQSARSMLSGADLAFQVRPVYVTGDTRMEKGPVPAATTVPFSVDFTHLATP